MVHCGEAEMLEIYYRCLRNVTKWWGSDILAVDYEIFSHISLKSLLSLFRWETFVHNRTVYSFFIFFSGNLYDAVGLAVRSALATSVVPVVKVTNQDKGEMEFSISDDPSDVWTPDVKDIPIFVTASKIGDRYVVHNMYILCILCWLFHLITNWFIFHLFQLNT